LQPDDDNKVKNQNEKTGGEDMNELEIVRQAGLTLYQSEAYLALKQQPDQTPTEVAHRSGVPQSKIYEILFALERLGLVKRCLNKKRSAGIDRKINDFLTEMKSHHVTLKAFGRGRIKQVWRTNGVSLASLVDKKIKQLERIKRTVARYEGLANS
jgi:DNA-binding MarR family transcriptional regulator